jgi:hypothetical protein
MADEKNEVAADGEKTAMLSDDDRPVTGSGLPTSITIILPPRTVITPDGRNHRCSIVTDNTPQGNPDPYRWITLNMVENVDVHPDPSGIGKEVIIQLRQGVGANFGLDMR